MKDWFQLKVRTGLSSAHPPIETSIWTTIHVWKCLPRSQLETRPKGIAPDSNTKQAKTQFYITHATLQNMEITFPLGEVEGNQIAWYLSPEHHACFSKIPISDSMMPCTDSASGPTFFQADTSWMNVTLSFLFFYFSVHFCFADTLRLT